MVGESTVRGKDAIRKWMASMDPQPPQFTIRRTVAEGEVVITQGDMVMPEKKDGAPIPYSFCDVYRFTDDKVAELNAFVIRTDKAGRREAAPAESERLSTAR
jgi:predicted SnoaL-like aldol condensation-catalyzing enzyme